MRAAFVHLLMSLYNSRARSATFTSLLVSRLAPALRAGARAVGTAAQLRLGGLNSASIVQLRAWPQQPQGRRARGASEAS